MKQTSAFFVLRDNGPGPIRTWPHYLVMLTSYEIDEMPFDKQKLFKGKKVGLGHPQAPIRAISIPVVAFSEVS